MATPDLSRHATDFRKHWEDVRMQQGRVLTDDDFNESARLRAEDLRRTRLDVIGPAGSPDDGFLIKIPGTPGATFTISAGTFYLGGLRLTLEKDEAFELQSDWLNQTANDRPLAPTVGRLDFVWIETWEQPVSAVEDSELLEVALGGPDTSVRVRKMHRVHVSPNVGVPDCVRAFASIRAGLNAELELVSDALLKVEMDNTAGTPDLCSPPVQGGYLGAENQAIRVQIVDATHFTWGFDNASPLYRVQMEAAPGSALPNLVKMPTPPKDHAHWPLAGQVVEILPWSALLPNGEKIAEISGHLATVQSSYDPDAQQFTIAPALPLGFGEDWKSRADIGTAAAVPAAPFFYLRVWNRGEDTASPAAIPTRPGVSLGHTGLKGTFTGTLRAGDFWIIAARPESPNVVVPRELTTGTNGRAAQGIRRWFAPLGVIRWDVIISPNQFQGTLVDDCRPTFPPLTRLGGCCTYTVGDNVISYGHFSSIQEAIKHLPPEGGKVCVLPGIFTENVLIKDRKNVTVAGCGPRSRVVSPAGTTTAVIEIQGGRNITVDSLAIETGDGGLGDTGPGVVIEGADPDFSRDPRRIDATLSDLTILAARDSAIRVLHVEQVTIRGCHVVMRNVECERHAVFVLGDDLLLERNLVEAPAELGESVEKFLPGNLSRGGIQIGGTSERVRILENLIRGGACTGITLGSRIFIDDQEEPVPPDQWPKKPKDPCPHARQANGILVALAVRGRVGDVRAASAGPLREIAIERNRIFQMGMNGIGVVGFFDPRETKELVHVEHLSILGNDIRECLRRELAEIPAAMLDLAGYGGIALADVEHLVIRDNTIADNGPSHLYPVCGIFVLHAAGMEVSRNHILNNGATTDEPPRDARSGRRGGIHVSYATRPLVPADPARKRPAFAAGVPALKVQANIVTAPLGPALRAAVLGPVSVTDNHFTSRGVAPARDAAPFGATVHIQNLGKVVDDQSQGLMTYKAMAIGGDVFPSEQSTTGFVKVPKAIDVSATSGPGTGDLLFSDNQCLLDLLQFNPFKSSSVHSIYVNGLGDIAFHGNQCTCKFPQAGGLLTATFINGYSVRVIDNRFDETPRSVIFSADTFGRANITTNNQANHCLRVRAGTPLLISFGNLIFVTRADPKYCARYFKFGVAGGTTNP